MLATSLGGNDRRQSCHCSDVSMQVPEILSKKEMCLAVSLAGDSRARCRITIGIIMLLVRVY